MSRTDLSLLGPHLPRAARSPGDAVDPAEQGFEAMHDGRFADASAWFESALGGPSAGDPRVLLSLAEARFYEGRYDEAERISRDLVDRDPADLQARALLGLALAQRGQPDEALRYLIKSPDHPAVHLGRALALGQLGDFLEAEAAVRQALKLAPDSAEAHRALGTTLTQQGRHGEALAEFTRALKLDPENAAAQAARDAVLLRLGQAPGTEPAE